MLRATILLTACLTISACTTTQGSYCAVYQPMNLNREAATALVDLDRNAAEAAVTNEDSYAECS